ncbi:MAG: YbjP/YqhG family protein [Verrucomicrobiota bacterium]|nr:YbjP/YqhG family protein [Verrucomicrobiota bacterium]
MKKLMQLPKSFSSCGLSFLLATVLIGLSVSSLPAQEVSPAVGPERLIREFYQWYVQTVLRNEDPFTERRAGLKLYATDRLLREIDQMRKGPEGLNGDYFVNAQDIDKEWAKSMIISPAELKGDTAIANVELKGTEVGSRKLRVSLVRQGGGWKVDKVEGL